MTRCECGYIYPKRFAVMRYVEHLMKCNPEKHRFICEKLSRMSIASQNLKSMKLKKIRGY